MISIKRLYIILKTNWLKTLIGGNKISFSSFEILTNAKKVTQNVNTVLDIGANQGQFQKAARYFYPDAQIYSFEPIPELFKGLEEKKDEKIKNFNCGLGNKEGELSFNKNEYSHSSSFLKVKDGNENFPSNQTTAIQVPIKTIDKLNGELKLESPVLMKLDVQGFELKVINGAESTLKNKVDYVIIESNFEELYEGQPSFTQLNARLNELGFELATLLDFNLGNQNQYIEADFLYVKRK